jgi:hypothetical protein
MQFLYIESVHKDASLALRDHHTVQHAASKPHCNVEPGDRNKISAGEQTQHIVSSSAHRGLIYCQPNRCFHNSGAAASESIRSRVAVVVCSEITSLYIEF